MNVVHLRWSLNYGGIETMLVNIANEQTLQGAEVSIIIINNIVENALVSCLSEKVNFVCLGRKAGEKSLSFIKKLDVVLKEINPDVIHLHGSVLFDLLPSNWRKKSCRVCNTLHTMPYGTCGINWRWGRIIQNLLFHKGGSMISQNRVGRVFSISNTVAQALKKDYGIDSMVISNGIITKKFLPREYNMPGSVFKILQVARLDHKQKGQDLLIEALNILVKQNVNCHLTFLGDGKSRDFLESLVSSLGLEERVTFLGTQSQEYVMNHLRDFDLYVHPSRFEGFGLTVAEAMAAGVPVLVTSHQGPAEITAEEKYGWVFSNGDTKDLAGRINYIISHYNLCIEKAKIARQHIIDNYDVKITADKYLNAYKEMINISC